VYLCHFCNRSSEPGDKLKLVVTKTRQVPQGSEGRTMTQTVEERAACPKCSETFGAMSSAVGAALVKAGIDSVVHGG